MTKQDIQRLADEAAAENSSVDQPLLAARAKVSIKP